MFYIYQISLSLFFYFENFIKICPSFFKMKKAQKLQANCMTMKSEFNQIHKKEKYQVDATERSFVQAVNRKNIEEIERI